jgi:alkaline phosphatase
MSRVALEILSGRPFFMVAEEEGTDDFSNVNNAAGSFEAGRRADEAFATFRHFVATNPRTMLITTADSSAGSKNIVDSGTFVSAPDRSGRTFTFNVVWASLGDLAGGMLARAEGLNASRVRELGIVDNTDIYRLMYLTLFGRWLP